MILTKLHIENFGKLHNIDFDFNQSITQLLQENGWGKSTFTIFIKSMFYGLPAKTRGSDYKSERTKYMPWQGGSYGGYLEFKKGEAVYRVTRVFGKTPESDTFELFDYKTNTSIKEEKVPLGEELFGIGEESFKMTAFFPQLDFKSSSNSELTANLTGVNKYQNDLANIDKAIKRLNEKRLEIKRQIPKRAEIEERRLALGQIKSLKVSLSDEIEKQRTNLEKLESDNSSLNDKITIEREKLNLQQDKYKNKTLIENKMQEFSTEINKLYSKQTEMQNKAIENLSSQRKNPFKKVLLALIMMALMLAVIATILYVFDIIEIALFITILALSIILFVMSLVLYKRQTKSDKNSQKAVVLTTDFKTKIDELNKELVKLNYILNNDYSDISLPESAILDELLQKQSYLKGEELSLSNKIINLNADLDNAINQEEYMSSQIAEYKDRLASFEEKYSIIEKTIDYLLRAKDNVASRYVSSINSEFSNILSKFNIDTKRFVIDNQWDVKEQTSVGSKEFEYSSQGLQDIISFCQRISLINKIYKKEKPFIILDDTFVNLDDNMMQCAKEVVKELSKSYQIFYICCHSRCKIIYN